MGNKLWGGRFRQDPDEALEAFNSSIGFDIRLYREEIAGSMAHCRGLEKAGILSQEEASQVIEALKQIELDIEQGRYQDLDQYEDIHHLVERALVEKIGEVGEKLHTARSRNDQVALDVRLYVRAQTKEVLSLIKGVQKELVRQAEANLDLILPGYTHLQRAQPVLLAHHLLGYYEMFRRDGARFEDGLKRVNVLPLGSGALAGTTFELDRRLVARELGFSEVSRNSMDAVSDRDFVLEFLFCSAMTMMHLSRLSEEIVLWATQEFGFVTIPDALATGSSIMPQKKNPDIPELVRGKTGRVYGNLMALLSTMKALPLAYNKDMQEDKEPLFDTVETLKGCLQVMARLLAALQFNREKMREAVSHGFLVATDLAEYLVRKGLPFRKAHEVVGRIVLYAIEKGQELEELTLEEMQAFSKHIEEDVFEWLSPLKCIERRSLEGGTGREPVRMQIRLAKKELGL